MDSVHKINVSDFIDNSRVGRFQIGVFVLCALGLIMAGFNLQSMGYVAPVLIPELGVGPGQMGAILGSANFGVLVGSLLFTMLGDRYGRRPILILSALIFAVFTILTARAVSVEQLLPLRFLAGIGIGSTIPNATALISEFSPAKNRITLIMCITVGFTAGRCHWRFCLSGADTGVRLACGFLLGRNRALADCCRDVFLVVRIVAVPGRERQQP